jgi:16S rRNA (uracil1498-N3)-methyltransferase
MANLLEPLQIFALRLYALSVQHFFIEPENLIGDKVVLDDVEIVHQIRRVLRMGVGGKFVALDNSGKRFVCEINAMDGEKKILASVIETKENNSSARLSVSLFQAMPKKPALFELILQKCTEIGVSRFVPIRTKFSEREEVPKKDRLLRIIKEAAEQSERATLPVLNETIDFDKLLSSPPPGVNLLLHSRGDFPMLSKLKFSYQKGQEINIFIGPEGGFSEEEVSLAQKNGFVISSLGTQILRTETAAIAAVAVFML